MRSKTTNKLCFKESDNPTINSNKPPYIVSPNKLNLLFDSDENDEALFARLKRERQLYREFNDAENPLEFRQRILTEVSRLGFPEYSFLRLNRVDTPADTDALIPTELLSSYCEKAAQRCGLMLQAGTANARNRHLSALFHYLANGAVAIGDDQYVLIVGSDGVGYYLVLTGLPASNRYVWMSGPGQPGGNGDFHQRVETNQYALNLLATTIEAIGTSRFPSLFKRGGGAPGPVTPRPLRLIHTLAKRDATLREAADRLCLSTDTINKHVAAAKSALGTNTLAGTLWQALKAGLIDTDEQ